MIFQETKFKGAYFIDLEKKEDERGFLARTFDKEQFLKHGIKFDVVQGYVSQSKFKGTIRGIHCQIGAFDESKLLRCSKGSIYEVIIDLRPDSPTYLGYLGTVIKAEDHRMLYIPAYFAHGILTLTDDTEIINFSDAPFTPEYERGIRFNDPFFKISWPIKVEHVSKKDLSWKPFSKENFK